MSKKKKGSSLSSMLSESIKLTKVAGQVVVNNRRPKRPEPSEKQAAVFAKFLEASQYAKQQIEQPKSQALYAKGITAGKRSAYMVAMSDYLSVPKVDSINTEDYLGAVGDTIVVKAVDDFMVTRVKVIITDAAGAILESGDAGPDSLKVNLWQYRTTVANPGAPPDGSGLAGTTIRAIAYDRPGNKGTREVVL